MDLWKQPYVVGCSSVKHLKTLFSSSVFSAALMHLLCFNKALILPLTESVQGSVFTITPWNSHNTKSICLLLLGSQHKLQLVSKGFTQNNFSPIVCPEAGARQEIGRDWVWQQSSGRHIPAPCCAPWGCVFRKQEALATRAMYYHPLNSLHCCSPTKTQGRLFIWNQNCMKISWGRWSSICGIFFFNPALPLFISTCKACC